MESPSPPSDLYKGRDRSQIESIKKLILSETDRAKFKKRGRAGGPAGSDSEGEAGSDDDKRDGAAAGSAGAAAADGDGAAGAAGKKAKPKGVWRKGKFIPYSETEEGRYRDRAKERRTGINPDYDGEIEKMVEVDAEKSKYLGGDLKHTHLVKGLDYALLLKVKEEARRKHEEERAAQDALAAQAGTVQPQEATASGVPTIHTHAGRALYAALTTVTAPQPPDFRRLVFEFDVTEEGADVPTVLARSNADVAALGMDDEDVDARVNYVVDDAWLSKLSKNLMAFRVFGRPGKRKKRPREREGSISGEPSTKPSKKATDVVDIFADIAPRARAGGGGHPHTIPGGDSDLPPPPPPPLPAAEWQPPLPPDDQPPPPPLPPSSAPRRRATRWGSVFSGLRAGGGAVEEDGESGAVAAPSREEVARSIKAAAARAAGGSGPPPPPVDEGGKIRRDVFGGEGRGGRGGHALGSGAYDVFPEGTGYEDFGGSDEEVEGTEGKKPRSRLGEAMDRKGGGKKKSRR